LNLKIRNENNDAIRLFRHNIQMTNTLNRSLFLLTFILFCCFSGFIFAQITELTNLNQFQPQKGNWTEVSKVTANPFKKNKLTSIQGKGILMNQNTAAKNSHLISLEEHGDANIELEFLMATGSNSGVYLMGRYEIQLFDSWGVQNPKFSDCGGLYQRWMIETNIGYDGIAPIVNASKAPGLWQKLQISFTAPKFDVNGKKMANAHVFKVYLNGAPIHRYAEFTGPTRGAAFNDEQAKGPLLIQGDHGPLAIRNLKITKFDDLAPHVEDVSFESFEGNYWNFPSFEAVKLRKAGKTNGINVKLAESTNDFGLRFRGNLVIPKTGEYTFSSKSNGQVRMVLGNKVLLDTLKGEKDYTAWKPVSKTSNIQEGTYPFELLHAKTNKRLAPALGIYVSTVSLRESPLHLPSSLNFAISTPGIELPIGSTVKMQRGFVEHQGSKKSYAVSVGEPNGAHYMYNFNTGALLKVWTGSFVDVTTMWQDRGNKQVMYANNAKQEFTDLPTFLTQKPGIWLDTASVEKELIYKGYDLDANQRPTFTFQLQGAWVKDKISGRSPKELSRTISWKKENGKPLTLLLADAIEIEQLTSTLWLINGQQWYLKINETKETPFTIVETAKGKQIWYEAKADEGSFEYSIIW